MGLSISKFKKAFAIATARPEAIYAAKNNRIPSYLLKRSDAQTAILKAVAVTDLRACSPSMGEWAVVATGGLDITFNALVPELVLRLRCDFKPEPITVDMLPKGLAEKLSDWFQPEELTDFERAVADYFYKKPFLDVYWPGDNSDSLSEVVPCGVVGGVASICTAACPEVWFRLHKELARKTYTTYQDATPEHAGCECEFSQNADFSSHAFAFLDQVTSPVRSDEGQACYKTESGFWYRYCRIGVEEPAPKKGKK